MSSEILSLGAIDLGRQEHFPRDFSLSRRELLQSLAAASLFTGTEVQKEDVPVEIVQEGNEKIPLHLHIFTETEQEGGKQMNAAAVTSLPSGRHKLYASAPQDMRKIVEVAYEVIKT